jgi:LPXTG-motif cell wall-anchored protein
MRITGNGDGQLRNVVVSADPGTNCPPGSTQPECITVAQVQATPPPTTPPPPPTPPTAPPTTQPDPGQLPATGGNSTPIGRIAIGLLLLGGLAVVLTRRRLRGSGAAQNGSDVLT